MTSPAIVGIKLGLSTQQTEPDQKSDETISSALQALSQIPHKAQLALSPESVTKIEKTNISQRIEEAFLENIRPFTPQLRTKMVQEAARGLRALYIDAAKGEEMASVILEKLKQGGYHCYDRQFPFKEQLQVDLREICHDLHLEIRYTLDPIPLDDPNRSLQELRIEDLTPSQLRDKERGDEAEKADMRKINFGVQSPKILPDTIGYLKMTQFARPDFEETFQKIDEAMTIVKDATALVIDLRGSQGGSPHTVARLASYLFNEKTLLNRIYQRSTDTTTEFYADPDKVSFRFGQAKPVCILVDNDTMSAAEELAYDLQAMKRGRVIGEKTWGGAHPIENFVIDDHFYLSIPNQKARNPITDTNWEGIGVIPDSLSPSKDALREAISALNRRVL